MLIGSARVSKADGSQALDLQRDALRAGGAHAKELSDGVGPQTITTGQTSMEPGRCRSSSLPIPDAGQRHASAPTWPAHLGPN